MVTRLPYMALDERIEQVSSWNPFHLETSVSFRGVRIYGCILLQTREREIENCILFTEKDPNVA
jgi:hypothetical protein